MKCKSKWETTQVLKKASVEFRVGELCRVKGGRSPAQRTLDADKFTFTLQGSGQAKPCCAWLPSPSGGEDRPAPGGGDGDGGQRKSTTHSNFSLEVK